MRLAADARAAILEEIRERMVRANIFSESAWEELLQEDTVDLLMLTTVEPPFEAQVLDMLAKSQHRPAS